MKNYGTGSMRRAVLALSLLSPLSVKDQRAVLIDFAAKEAEQVLLQEREAGRDPDPRSWEAVRSARAFLRGETERQSVLAALHGSRTAQAIANESDVRSAWPAAHAAHEVSWAALGGKDTIENAVRVLLAVSFYAYTVSIGQAAFSDAIDAECSTMDRHKATLRALLIT